MPDRDGSARPGRLIEFDHALGVIGRHRWLLLGVVALALLVAAVVTAMTTAEYRAVSTLQINAQPAQIISSRSQPLQRFRNDDQYLQTQYGILRSRSLALRVVRKLGLAADPGFVAQSGSLDRQEEAAVGKLMAKMAIEPQRGSDLVRIAYVDTVPERAARIANAFAAGFIDTTTENRYNTTNFARNFLQDQLSSARRRLENSERALVQYAQNQKIVQVESGRTADGPTSGTGDTLSSQSMVAFNNALDQATADRIAAEQAYGKAAAAGVSNEHMQDPAILALRTERIKLEEDYREKLGTFKPDYPDMVALRARIDQVQAALARETGVVDSSLRVKYQAAAGRENELRARVNTMRSQVLDLRNRGIGYNFLQRDVDTNRELYGALLQRYKEIGVVGELGESQATVIDTAVTPRGRYEPRPMRNLGIGLVVGLLVGMVIAFVHDFIDDTVKTVEDISTQLGLAALGVVPLVSRGSNLSDELSDAKSPVTEGYHSIVTALRFVGARGATRSLLVTSSLPGEGKSSTSLALAQNLAHSGARVLLIDADMRNPTFAGKGEEALGLSGLLASDEPLADHIEPTRIEHLWLLPAGTIPPNPAALLATFRIHEIIASAVEGFDLVVIDAPPVLGLSDAPILGSICDATVLVVEAGAVRSATVQGAMRRLSGANAAIVGAVLTKYRPKSGQGKDYGYGYGYGYGGDGGKRGGTVSGWFGRGARSGQTKILDLAKVLDPGA